MTYGELYHCVFGASATEENLKVAVGFYPDRGRITSVSKDEIVRYPTDAVWFFEESNEGPDGSCMTIWHSLADTASVVTC